MSAFTGEDGDLRSDDTGMRDTALFDVRRSALTVHRWSAVKALGMKRKMESLDAEESGHAKCTVSVHFAALHRSILLGFGAFGLGLFDQLCAH